MLRIIFLHHSILLCFVLILSRSRLFIFWELYVPVLGFLVDGWARVQLLTVHDVEDLQTVRFFFDGSDLGIPLVLVGAQAAVFVAAALKEGHAGAA